MHPKDSQMSGGKGKDETCPDCGEKITLSNPRIDEHDSGDLYGNCVSCYDPTPQHYDSTRGPAGGTGYDFRYGPNS